LLENPSLEALPEPFARWLGINVRKIPEYFHYSISLTPTSVSANTTSEQTYTVTGLKLNDVVYVNPPSYTTGVGISGCDVSAANTLRIQWSNPTGGALTPPSGNYKIIAIRR